MEPPKPKETVEHLQPSVPVLVARLLAVIFIIDGVYSLLILGFAAVSAYPSWHVSYVSVLFIAQVAKYLFVAAAIIQLFSQWAGQSYFLHGHHLVERLGLVNITEKTYELSQVKSVEMRQTWFARRFNYGTIKLSFASASKKPQEVILADVTNPMKYKSYFDDHLQIQGWVR